MHRPPRIGGQPGASLEEALTGGCWHSGRFPRDAYDRPGGSLVASTGRIGVGESVGVDSASFLESSPSNLTRLQKALRVGSKLALRRCVFTALPLSTRCTQRSAEHTSALLPDTMNAHQQDLAPPPHPPCTKCLPCLFHYAPLPPSPHSASPRMLVQHVLVQLTSKSQSSRCPRR